ncbi:ArnT family glycosyltransferase [Pontiella sulfatireligans]|uniref:Glycosyltransferase RgtA/B/C/D-like domain-containing protein n=1 Tax=Pontiella sulfatireligans TaxID=2750658 RepID=A0A6C2UHK1_9BACT|nr:glycosyltransferase family 39 protein [Pontiella sulfatireligans]VGO19670.1 hypothetical protein SCARR_01729 [Pontiella sulfatireligans]
MAQDNRSFESTLHDIVYSIDTGTGLKIIRVTLYFLFLLVIVMLYSATQFRGLKTEEAMDLAQLGRNMTPSGGMVTKCVRPVTMWKVSERTPGENPRIDDHPDLLHPPAYPAVLAAGFKFFEFVGADPFSIPIGSRSATMPAEQWVVLPINHIFTILTGGLLFLMGKRLFSREIGFLGMTIYYLSNVAWQDSISGLNISMATFFVMAAFYAMVVSMLNRRDGSTTAGWAVPFVLSVLFAAIAFLTRYIAAAAVPGIALFAWLMSGRFRGGTRFALVFIVLFMVLISPWLYRNFKISGNPVGMAAHTSLADTTKYPDTQFSRQLHPNFSFGQFSSELKKKWVTNYSENHQSVLPGLGGGVLMSLFLVTFFYHFVRPQVNYLRWGIGLSLLLTTFIAGFFSESSIRMIHVFWPFVILYGMAFFYILIDRLDLGVRLYNVGLKCLLVALAVIPLGLTLMPPHANHPYPPYYAPFISTVSGWLTPREVMVTDMPWATAWYGDRISIQLPKDLDDFYEINDYKQYISGMYITTITKDKPFVKQLLDGPEQSWLPVMSGRTPPDFPLKQITALNRQDQIFLSDRDRWSAGGPVAPAQ